jgi:hypothetical protein
MIRPERSAGKGRANEASLQLLAYLRPLALACGLTIALTADPAGAADPAPTYPPALRVGLVPPPDFVPSPQFPGFIHNDKQISIILNELPGYAFDAIDKQVTAEIEKQPAGTIVREPFTLKSGAKAFIVYSKPGSAQGPVLKWSVFANSDDVTAVATALVPEAVKDAAPEAAIKASLATLTVRGKLSTQEQLSVLPFSMSQLAGFRIVRVQPGVAAMLTDGPKDVIESTEQPLLLVSIFPAQNAPAPEERDGFSRRLLGDIPGIKEAKVTRSEPLRVAGQQGYETQIEAKDIKTGDDINGVQWLRFGTGTLLRIVALARKDKWHDAFTRFREVRDGIGPKQ